MAEVVVDNSKAKQTHRNRIKYEMLKEAALDARLADDIDRAEELERLGLELYFRIQELLPAPKVARS